MGGQNNRQEGKRKTMQEWKGVKFWSDLDGLVVMRHQWPRRRNNGENWLKEASEREILQAEQLEIENTILYYFCNLAINMVHWFL